MGNKSQLSLSALVEGFIFSLQVDARERLTKTNELIAHAQAVEVPSGDIGQIVSQILREVSRNLRPLAAVYAGFQLGVAYERFQKTDHE